MNHRRAARVAPLKGASRVGLASCDFVLDPNDRAIEESIKRIERKTYVKDGLIPEIQCLLLMPPAEAKAAFIGHLTQYSLVTMLLLASLLGTALAPLDPEAYPSRQMSVAAFNMMAMIICCGTLFGTCTFVLEAVTIESTPTDRIHSVIAKADKVFGYGIGMAALALQGTAPLIVLRAWVSGLNQAMCITLTAVVAPLWVASLDVFEAHLQKAHPMMAQLCVIVFAPWRYRKEPSHAAVDELVAGLRYLQQARDKTLTPAQLGACAWTPTLSGTCCWPTRRPSWPSWRRRLVAGSRRPWRGSREKPLRRCSRGRLRASRAKRSTRGRPRSAAGLVWVYSLSRKLPIALSRKIAICAILYWDFPHKTGRNGRRTRMPWFVVRFLL